MNRRNHSAPHPRRLELAVAALLIGVPLLAVYLPSLGGHFTYGWDDRWLLTENRTVHGFSGKGVRDVFDPTIDRASLGFEYLPVRDLSYMADHEFWGLNPIGYRLTSLLVHAASSIAVFLLLSRFVPGRIPALGGALIFALHPLAAEPVAWVAGRKDVLAVFFGLATSLALLSATEPGRTRADRRVRYAASLALAVAAGLSKSSAAGWLAALPLLLLLEGQSLRRATAALPHLLVAVLATAVHVAVFRTGNVLDVERAADSSIRLGSLGPGLLHTARSILVPIALAPHYRDPVPDGASTAILGAAAGLLALGGTLVLILRPRLPAGRPLRALAFALPWTLVALAPVLAPLPRHSAYLADRYAYPAAFALGLLGATWIAAAARGRIARALLVLAVALPLGLLSRDRALAWRSEVRLWRDAVERDPRAPISRLNLASALERLAPENPVLLDEAERQYREALDLEPDMVKARYNLAVLLVRRHGEGRRAEAKALLARAIETDPRFHQARGLLGGLLLEDGDVEGARAHIEKGIETNGDYAPLWLQLGNLRREQGRPEEARAAYDRALELAPGRPEILRARESLDSTIRR